jgi:hypothetical protein
MPRNIHRSRNDILCVLKGMGIPPCHGHWANQQSEWRSTVNFWPDTDLMSLQRQLLYPLHFTPVKGPHCLPKAHAVVDHMGVSPREYYAHDPVGAVA